jgi:acetyl-CoA carboxylase carboxyl transferase subunit beta
MNHRIGGLNELKRPGIQAKGPAVESKAPANLWTKCLDCGTILYRIEIERNRFVCPKCDSHFTMPARERMALLLDPDTFQEMDADLGPRDALGFVDQVSYAQRLLAAQKKTSEKDAAIWGHGLCEGKPLAVTAFVFEFMAGSMGSVVGEKITRCFEYALDKKMPAVVVAASGGARMQEGILSLMQMVKTCAALSRMKREGIPYIALLAHPTTGGVAASFAMLGDVAFAEPNALIGFAGPRVIEQTIRQKLPEGFQRSPFLLDHGMIDQIVHRKDQKKLIARTTRLLYWSRRGA